MTVGLLYNIPTQIISLSTGSGGLVNRTISLEILRSYKKNYITIEQMYNKLNGCWQKRAQPK